MASCWSSRIGRISGSGESVDAITNKGTPEPRVPSIFYLEGTIAMGQQRAAAKLCSQIVHDWCAGLKDGIAVLILRILRRHAPSINYHQTDLISTMNHAIRPMKYWAIILKLEVI